MLRITEASLCTTLKKKIQGCCFFCRCFFFYPNQEWESGRWGGWRRWSWQCPSSAPSWCRWRSGCRRRSWSGWSCPLQSHTPNRSWWPQSTGHCSTGGISPVLDWFKGRRVEPTEKGRGTWSWISSDTVQQFCSLPGVISVLRSLFSTDAALLCGI